MREGLCRVLVPAFAALAGACSKHDSAGDRPPPPPPPPVSQEASAGPSAICADGGAVDPDSVSAPFVPRSAGGFCLDPQGEPKTYGDKGKFSMDDVCTTAFDGECEV
ncbi:MAG: hypothetical protein ACRENE_16305, partial [Polyangiaceae bacterium]